MDASKEIQELVERAHTAQQAIEHYSQAQADELVTAVGWQVVKHKEELARAAVEEGGFGNYEAKVAKIRLRVTGVLKDMEGVKTVGVIEENPSRGLIKIAKPVGVIAALIPSTGPDATPPMKALCALKGRNAIIIAAHPKTQGSSVQVVERMREGCARVGAPQDLIQIVRQPSITKTQELMRQVDLIVATGGADMVKSAYSSGTPAYGVGVGNSVHVVDETADLDDAASCVARAKTFDFATSCLADNALIVHEQVYAALLEKLIGHGAYLCNTEEKARLQATMWPSTSHIPALAVIAKPASRIAELAGITLPAGRTFLIVEEDGVGADHPFSGEKLSVVLALYRYRGGIDAAVARVNEITSYQGLGHTCGIHTRSDAHVDALAFGTKTARVLVNQNLNEGAGSPRNGLPFTLSLACGTWGRNITTENINARHFVNLTWVSRILPVVPPPVVDDDLFGEHWRKFGQ
jgi:sulfoacetaldehyde dehydrogenase